MCKTQEEELDMKIKTRTRGGDRGCGGGGTGGTGGIDVIFM